MRLIAAFLLAALPLLAVAAEGTPDVNVVNKLVERMASEDFDEREAATIEASKLPLSWAKFLAKLATGYGPTDQEVEYRLKLAVFKMFELQALPKDARWKRTQGTVEFEYSDYFSNRYRAPPPWAKGEDGEPQAMVVANSWGGCNESIKSWDVITHVDGKTVEELHKDPLSGWGLWEPGREYELKIKRPRNPDVIAQRGCINDEDEFDDVVVKIKAIQDDNPKGNNHGCNAATLFVAERMAWNDFISEVGITEEFTPLALTRKDPKFRP